MRTAGQEGTFDGFRARTLRRPRHSASSHSIVEGWRRGRRPLQTLADRRHDGSSMLSTGHKSRDGVER